MNVSDLIAELRRYPGHIPVRVLTSSVLFVNETGEEEVQLTEWDATEASDVKYEGSHVLVIG